MRQWADVKEAAAYTHRSERVIRYWLKNGLRHIRVNPGGVLTTFQWLDEFLLANEVWRTRVDAIVDEVMASMRKGVKTKKRRTKSSDTKNEAQKLKHQQKGED